MPDIPDIPDVQGVQGVPGIGVDRAAQDGLATAAASGIRAADPNLLLLVDGRLPDGAYAHSGGLEAVAGMGLVRDVAGLAAFLRGRLETVGVTAAALAATAAGLSSSEAGSLRELDALADARMPSPAAREASRRQGRNLVRAASRAWPSPVYEALPDRPHHPVALGTVAAAAGLTAGEAALAAAYGSVTAPAGAAVRLLSLDPLTVHALLANLAGDIRRVAAHGATSAELGDIPALAAPLLEVGAEDHATWEVRLFAS